MHVRFGFPKSYAFLGLVVLRMDHSHTTGSRIFLTRSRRYWERDLKQTHRTANTEPEEGLRSDLPKIALFNVHSLSKWDEMSLQGSLLAETRYMDSFTYA
jgi:hypothetical protein